MPWRPSVAVSERSPMSVTSIAIRQVSRGSRLAAGAPCSAVYRYHSAHEVPSRSLRPSTDISSVIGRFRGPTWRWYWLRGKVDQEVARWRQVAAMLIDATLQPLASSELVRRQIPFQDFDLARRTPTKHDRHRRLSRDDEMDAGLRH
jgi:hypothetical protein